MDGYSFYNFYIWLSSTFKKKTLTFISNTKEFRHSKKLKKNCFFFLFNVVQKCSLLFVYKNQKANTQEQIDFQQNQKSKVIVFHILDEKLKILKLEPNNLWNYFKVISQQRKWFCTSWSNFQNTLTTRIYTICTLWIKCHFVFAWGCAKMSQKFWTLLQNVKNYFLGLDYFEQTLPIV